MCLAVCNWPSKTLTGLASPAGSTFYCTCDTSQWRTWPVRVHNITLCLWFLFSNRWWVALWMFVVTAATGAAVALHPILVAAGEHLSLQQHCGIPFGHHWGLMPPVRILLGLPVLLGCLMTGWQMYSSIMIVIDMWVVCYNEYDPWMLLLRWRCHWCHVRWVVTRGCCCGGTVIWHWYSLWSFHISQTGIIYFIIIFTILTINMNYAAIKRWPINLLIV